MPPDTSPQPRAILIYEHREQRQRFPDGQRSATVKRIYTLRHAPDLSAHEGNHSLTFPIRPTRLEIHWEGTDGSPLALNWTNASGLRVRKTKNNTVNPDTGNFTASWSPTSRVQPPTWLQMLIHEVDDLSGAVT